MCGSFSISKRHLSATNKLHRTLFFVVAVAAAVTFFFFFFGMYTAVYINFWYVIGSDKGSLERERRPRRHAHRRRQVSVLPASSGRLGGHLHRHQPAYCSHGGPGIFALLSGTWVPILIPVVGP